MKIYSVIWKDRHADTTSKPFLDLDEAIAWARKNVQDICSPEDYKESTINGWEFFAEYSGEGDCIYITSEFIEEPPKVRWEKEIYKKAMFIHGPENQREMLAEECSELAAAVNQFKRKRISVDDLCEEIADVEIMIGQMRVMYSTIIDKIKVNKLKRLEKRLKKD